MVAKQDLISVIIPIYNGSNYLSRMIKMMKAQTFKNIEIIIVDDGSIDNTINECVQLTKDDKRFRLFSKTNGGVSSARNYGISKAVGDLIAFVDVDDYIYPEYLEKLYDLLKRYNADWSQCSFIKVKENFQPKHYEKMRVNATDKKQDKELLFNKTEAFVDFAYRRHLGGSSYLKLIKRSIAVQISFREDLKYGEDYIYTYELLKRTNRIAYLDSVEYLYVQSKESATHIKRSNSLEYQKGWEQLNLIYKEIGQVCPQAQGGVLEKCYMQAIKDTSRISEKDSDKEYLEKLYEFIKENGKYVFYDRENTAFRRVLGLFGSVLPKMLCAICRFIFQHGFTLRKLP